MAWNHIFWNDEFIVTNKDNYEDYLAGRVFGLIQYEIYFAMGDKYEWPNFGHNIWNFKLKHIFLEILEFVKKGARKGPSGGKNSPRIKSIIIANDGKPHISIVMFDEKEQPILEIPESLDDIQFFGDISHMV
tara:strand:+ start:680 stop:1075 length:396 start_codon:yes stop_codon:yes gene_type:complete